MCPLTRGEGERLDEPSSERDSPAGDSQDDDVPGSVVALQDLVRNTEQGSGYVRRSEDLLARGWCAGSA